MITEAFLGIIYVTVYAISAPLRLLGDVELDSEISQNINAVADVLATFDFLIPVNIIITILAILVVFTGSYLTYKGINWFIRKIPTVS